MPDAEQRFPSKSNALRFLLSRGLTVGTVIDVGVQQETAVLHRLFPAVKHILIEPVEDYFDRIRENYKAVDFDLLPLAASNRDGPGTLTLLRRWDNIITHSHVSGAPPGESRTIEEARLDTMLKGRRLAEPFLLKIDVDGHEAAVIEGAEETLKKSACVILEAPLSVLTQRIEMIAARGFKLWEIVDLCYLRGVLSQVDLIFISDDLARHKNFAHSDDAPTSREEWRQLVRTPWPRAAMSFARRAMRRLRPF